MLVTQSACCVDVVNGVYSQLFQVGEVFKDICRQFSDVVHADLPVETQSISMNRFFYLNHRISNVYPFIFVLTGL